MRAQREICSALDILPPSVNPIAHCAFLCLCPFCFLQFGLALLGFALSVWQLYDQDASPKTITLRGLDLITIVVPPSLPLALSVGTNFALMALKAHKLFCIQPSRINVAGKIQLMAFDKTGTLTAEGMEMRGVLASNNGSFSAFAPTMSATDRSSEDESHSHSQAQSPGVEGGSGLVVMGGKLLGWGERSSSPDDGEGFGEGINLSTFRSEQHNEQQPLPRDVKYCMGCCHALAHLDGALIGDPLEVEIYKASGGRLSDTSRDGFVCFVSFDAPYDGNRSSLSSQSTLNLGVRTQFEFVAALQRMSVIVQDVANPSSVSVYAKGSPEVMKSLCTPDSIPEDFDDKLREYAQKGYRIIAMGCKALDADMLQKPIEKEDLRRLCEAELRFLGLLVLENKVKPETAPTLRVLQDAKVRCVMVTGDNPVTGTAVAKECGLVPDNTRIFLAQLSHDAQGMARLHWHDTDAADAHAPGSMRLNPRTLQLEGAVSPGPDVRFELALTGAAYKYLEDRFLAESGHSNKWVWESDRERREEEEEGALSATRMFHTVLLNCLVFARMTPEQKASVVAHLQSLGIYVGFCGDGGNDAPALKMAHIGVSLSESEASIAAVRATRSLDRKWVANVGASASLICPCVFSLSWFPFVSAIHLCSSEHFLHSSPSERRSLLSHDLLPAVPVHGHVLGDPVQRRDPALLLRIGAGELGVPAAGHVSHVSTCGVHGRHEGHARAIGQATQRKLAISNQHFVGARAHGHLPVLSAHCAIQLKDTRCKITSNNGMACALFVASCSFEYTAFFPFASWT